MYDIFGCVSDFAYNFSHLTPTTLNCGATREVGNVSYCLKALFVLQRNYSHYWHYKGSQNKVTAQPWLLI